MNTKKLVSICITSILIFSFLTSFIVLTSEDGTNDGEKYYAYGDSITAGKEIHSCGVFNYDQVHVCQMVRNFDPVAYGAGDYDHERVCSGYEAWVEKGNIFQLQDNIRFISIEGGINGTTIYTSTPTINWTIEEDTSQYWLQIDNNPDFSSPEVNYTDINQYNYPTNCDINSTRVSFTLPTELNEYNTYYMRVRANYR